MLTASVFRRAMISGVNNIANHRQKVDELNVFPVPDGDTGTNMSMTISAVVPALEKLNEEATVSEAAAACASALLRGARGNSGVILSLLFSGLSKGFKECEEVDCTAFANSFAKGVEAAYKAVMKPTEGTILTVARLAAEKGKELAETTEDVGVLFDLMLQEAQRALDDTPNMLPVLKKAGVVDAGGQGLVYIMAGMVSVMRDDVMVEASEGSDITMENFSVAIADFDEEINFTYCTEFLLERKADASEDELREYLMTIGDCVVVVGDEEIIKVHVHTEDPGNALQAGLKQGALIKVKVENMRKQNENVKEQTAVKEEEAEEYPVKPEKPIGFVAVAAGEGLQELFLELGVDKMVKGGQTMNPSTEDILKAIQSTPAETVFVLPNNKNIIMAAEQAVPIADRKVIVLPTKTIPQGLSAMLAFDPDSDEEINQENMMAAVEHVQSGQVTFAARDSEYAGYAIKKGEILAMENGKLAFVEKDLNKALVKLAKNLVKAVEDGFCMTLIYGEDVTEEQASAALEQLQNKFDDFEISLVKGDQPVYYYILSVE